MQTFMKVCNVADAQRHLALRLVRKIADESDDETREVIEHFLAKVEDDEGREPIVKQKETNTMNADDKLDELAKDYAAKHNVSFAKAYDAVLATPEGSDLYTKSTEEHAENAEAAVKAAAKAPPPREVKKTLGEMRLEALAKDRMQKTNETYEVAFTKVLETEEGKVAGEVMRREWMVEDVAAYR